MTGQRPRAQVRTLTVDGRRFAVTHRPGRPGRVPLVLCSGIGAPRELFDPFVDALDPDRPVVRFDVPGVGGSAPAALPYRFAGLARGLRGITEQLGHPSVDVLGISWGGGLAQQYAARYPSHCRRVVLVATGTGALMIPAAPWTLARMLTPRRHRDPEYARRIAGELYGGSARHDPDAAVGALHRAVSATPRRAYLYQLLAVAGWTSLPLLPRIGQPTLVVAGDDDPLIPAVNASIMTWLLPRGRLHLYHGGHLHLLTDPAALVPVIETFLDATDQRVTDQQEDARR